MRVNPRTKETEKTDNPHIIKKIELIGTNFCITNMSKYIKICPYTNTVW